MMTDRKKGYLYLIVTFCIWGSMYVVGKFVLGKVSAFTVLFFRYFIAEIALFFVLKKKELKKIEKEDYKYILLIGAGGYFVSVGAQLLGTKLASASLASLINSMNPVATMLFASIMIKEKLTVKKMACIIMAIVGVYTVIGGVNNDGQIVGILFSVFALITWSFVTVTVRKISKKYDSLQITTYGIAVAIACTLPFSIYEFVKTPNVQVDAAVVFSLIYIGLFPTALAFGLWNKSLCLIDASTCSSFYPIQPLISFLLGWMFLGETITLSFVFGAILIIGGVFLSVIDIKEVPIFMISKDKFNRHM